jgi:GDP-L-fucose synthase
MLQADSRIYVAGHRGLVGSAIVRRLQAAGHRALITRTHAELDLTDAQATQRFFEAELPEFVFLAAAKVGGIAANQRCRPSSSTTTWRSRPVSSTAPGAAA